jgi:integrase
MFFKPRVEREVQRFLETREVGKQMLYEYSRVAKWILQVAGNHDVKRIDDLKQLLDHGLHGQNLSPVSIKRNRVQAKTILRYLEKKGIKIGDLEPLKSPPARALRESRNKLRMFAPEQARTLVERSDRTMRAAHLLAFNAAFTQIDLLNMPTVEGEWLNFPRVKTGIQRIAWLWPETREALNGVRFDHLDRWRIGRRHREISTEAGIRGLSFVAARRSWLTWASASGAQQFALDAVMGHVPQGIQATYYRCRIYKKPIREVCEFTRQVYLGEVDLE